MILIAQLDFIVQEAVEPLASPEHISQYQTPFQSLNVSIVQKERSHKWLGQTLFQIAYHVRLDFTVQQLGQHLEHYTVVWGAITVLLAPFLRHCVMLAIIAFLGL